MAFKSVFFSRLAGGNDEVAAKVCRHIIGMKPLRIGMKDFEEEKDSSGEDEDRLALQDFVFDPDSTVGQILKDNDMEISSFWRFECAQPVIVARE